MPSRSRDWLNQALRDLDQAEDSRRAGRHEWACFAAQQAAEKAVKALHLHLGQEAWGHVISKLFSELPKTISLPQELIEKGRTLGRNVPRKSRGFARDRGAQCYDDSLPGSPSLWAEASQLLHTGSVSKQPSRRCAIRTLRTIAEPRGNFLCP